MTPLPGAKPLRRVLVANRGEIALRIIRACRELGLETLQVYSEADADSLAVRLADRAVCIGPARSNQSYLNAEFIVSAALIHQADAVHPGYGFLSENAAFAGLCEMEGLGFIGPRADVIAMMGDKARARQLASEAGVPTTPGSSDKVSNAQEAAAVAQALGYPVLLKAAAGGGGRGMRVVHSAAELAGQFADASREAKASFGDDAIYLEKYLTNIRHIEIQVLADGATVLHLGERDCSIQRRNQKLLEESPSPVLDEEVRARMGEAAVRLCRHVGYTSAGTIEFILDQGSGEFYFMEMNTRVQVEHPVTEMVTGIDIVKAQIRIAQGLPLALRQEDIRLSGHAIECRINAEDFENGFAPHPGLVQHYHAPGGPGIRVDSHLYSGYRIPPYYDSLVAKVVAWGEGRTEAIARMKRALCEMEITGIKTTIPFHLKLLHHEAFLRGDVHTQFVENNLLQGK
ncbi:biotin carboxylase [mine drainage metagenome]|uniref:Biotin carboxylase n=1 Tax=mine drainage metagenome TaxID=410659 RepID=A0A1J5QUL5_9ZZZZ